MRCPPARLPASSRVSRLALLPPLLLAVGCGERESTAPPLAASVSLSVTATVEGTTGPEVRMRDPAHELVIERVALVLEGVELSGAGGDAPLEHRPFVLDVPLHGVVRSLLATAVAPGRYPAMRLRLRPPARSDPHTLPILLDHPDVEGVSVRVEGRWDGEPFTFGRPLDDVQQIALTPPLEVEGRTTNLTLSLDVGSWFRAPDGTLMDPRALEGDTPPGRAVEERIRASFAAFEDADVDGVAGGD